MRVVGIRGSNGSGKTHVARRIMERDIFVKEHRLENGVLINVYEHFVAIGKYIGIVCGGADTCKEYSSVWPTIVECAEHSNVLFEGVLVGTTYQPTMDLVQKLKTVGASYIPICLDTSLEQCVDNVNARRATEGKDPIAKIDNIEINYRKHLSSARKFRAAGMNPRWVSADEAVQIACEEFGI